MMYWHALWLLLIFGGNSAALAGIVTKLSGTDPVIALTFDACETKTPSHFDKTIIDYLVREEIPFTIFINGKFAKRNGEDLRLLSEKSFIEIENHSMNHFQHMEKLNEKEIQREVVENESLIVQITEKRPVFFRFPAGNHDQRSVKIVEDLGYRVVHWTFASGDPVKETTPTLLARWVVGKAKKGDILIFHVNGRGHSTGEALPHIVQQLRKKGFQFVLLKDLLPTPQAAMLQKSDGSHLK